MTDDGVSTIYTDLDSTLLGLGGSLFVDSGGRPTDRAACALSALMQKGIEVIPVSGRTVSQMAEICRVIGSRRYIAEMGSFICDRTGELEVTPTFTMDSRPGESAYEAIAGTGAPGFLLEQYPGRLEYHEPWAGGRECTHLFRGQVEPDEVNGRLRDFGAGHLELVDNGPVRRLGNLSVGKAHAYHLVPKGVTKGSALELDVARRHVGDGRCVAIGDSETDLTMAAAVYKFYLVADPATASKRLLKAASELPNTEIVDEPGPLGWAAVARRILAEQDASPH